MKTLHYCPFCSGKYSRTFLLNQHIPECVKREKYLKKELDPLEMEEIRKRVNGEIDMAIIARGREDYT